MTSRKVELSSLDDLFTIILSKFVEEKYHRRVVIESNVDKGKDALEHALE